MPACETVNTIIIVHLSNVCRNVTYFLYEPHFFFDLVLYLASVCCTSWLACACALEGINPLLDQVIHLCSNILSILLNRHVGITKKHMLTPHKIDLL